jgi:hypothetical protein
VTVPARWSASARKRVRVACPLLAQRIASKSPEPPFVFLPAGLLQFFHSFRGSGGIIDFHGSCLHTEVPSWGPVENFYALSSMMAIGLTQPALAFLMLMGKQQTVNP